MSFWLSTFFILLLISLGSLFYNKRNDFEYLKYPTTNTNISDSNELADKGQIKNNSEEKTMYKILVIADSHSNFEIVSKLLEIISSEGINHVVHLGDHTDYGDLDSLKEAKDFLDSLNVNYSALPGDRDLGQTSSTQNFYVVFKKEDTLFLKGDKILFINNSYNFTPINQNIFSEYLLEIPNSEIIFLSQPILVERGNIFSNKYMGSDTAFSDLNQDISKSLSQYRVQRNLILSEILKNRTPLVVAGDHHRSLTFNDNSYPNTLFHIVGATSKNINSGNYQIKQESLQTKRVSIIEKKGGKFLIKEVVIN